MTVTHEDTAALRDRLGPYGVWIAPLTLLAAPVAEQRIQFRRIEELGFGSVWTGEAPVVAPGRGREIFAQLAILLAATDTMVAGAGIANITMRDPAAMHGAAATLAEAYPGRLVLGLGGQGGERPLTALRSYLDRMDRVAQTLLPGVVYPRVLAALGPRALELAGTRADGAHPFSHPVAHTAFAREALGPGPLLVPHQFLLADVPAGTARDLLRTTLSAGAGNKKNPYAVNFRRLGYTEADVTGDYSDRLIDDILVAGAPESIAERLGAHHDAGADHVLLHPLAPGLAAMVDQLAKLAPLLGLG